MEIVLMTALIKVITGVDHQEEIIMPVTIHGIMTVPWGVMEIIVMMIFLLNVADIEYKKYLNILEFTS